MDQSALLKHELAYCLGQMQDKRAIPTLTAVLKDREQEVMVRHEAGTQTHTVIVDGFPSPCLLEFSIGKDTSTAFGDL